MSRSACWLTTLVLIAAQSMLSAATVPPPPDPGLAASVRAADIIADVEILAGGPFRAAAAVRRVYRGQPPRVFELSGYNSLNWDATSASFETGSRWILFLSNTDRPDTLAPLTPSAPRLPVKDGTVLLSLGDPPFRLPIAETDLSAALELMASAEPDVDRGVAFIRELWARKEVEPRYLATALAGWLGDARTVPLLAEAAQDKLLRLRLLVIETLRRIPAPESLAVLRSMLKDERDIVTREAAAALVEAQDAIAVPELLAWACRAAEAKTRLPEDDSRRKTSAQYINRLLLLLLDVGPLLPRDAVFPGLLSMARSTDAESAKMALFVMDRLAGRDEIDRLAELAEDPVYPHAREAALSFFRASLQPALDQDLALGRWKRERETFGEQTRIRRVREAAMGLSLGSTDDLPLAQLSVLLSAPTEVVLPEIASLLLDERGTMLFETRHLSAWRGPLTLPFTLTRLSSADAQDRALALQSLALTLQRHPRLAPFLRPLVRAHLADPEPLVRRMACSACGMLGDAASFPLLLQSLRGGIAYEAREASQAIFDLSARTMGYAYHELTEDNDVAVRRLSAWWDRLPEKRQTSWHPPGVSVSKRIPGQSTAELEALLSGEDSRSSGAALALLLERCPASDALWVRLLSSERPRDRAHGVVGLFGAPASTGTDLAAVLKNDGPGADLPKALALPVLASLRGGRGPDQVVEWLEGPGAGTSLAWRSLAILSLALADGEPRSLTWLQKALASGLASEPEPDPDPFAAAPIKPTHTLMKSVLLALAARADSSTILTGALRSRAPETREWVARTLALRGCTSAAAEILNVLDKADRYGISDLARAVVLLPKAEAANQLAEQLSEGTEAGRLGAALILAKRPDLGTAPVLRGALIQALQDSSSAVRARAAECLGRMQARAAVPSLEALLTDLSAEPRTAAIEALSRIGDRQAARAAAQEARLYTQLDPRWMPILGLSDSAEDLRLLLTAAQSESWIERRGALKGLGFSRQPEALKYLLTVFRESRSPYHTHAGEALADQGPAALEALAPDLKSTRVSVRASALFWLDRCPQNAGAPYLLEALRDTDTGVRQLADWILRRKTDKDAGFDAQAPAGQREERITKWQAILKD